MTDKSQIQNLRRLAARAGLRIATLRTDAGRVFALLDGKRIVSLCVGHAAAQQLVTKSQAGVA